MISSRKSADSSLVFWSVPPLTWHCFFIFSHFSRNTVSDYIGNFPFVLLFLYLMGCGRWEMMAVIVFLIPHFACTICTSNLVASKYVLPFTLMGEGGL